MATTTKEPVATGEGFYCPCGSRMELVEIDAFETTQTWECEAGERWIRDLTEAEWRKDR